MTNVWFIVFAGALAILLGAALIAFVLLVTAAAIDARRRRRERAARREWRELHGDDAMQAWLSTQTPDWCWPTNGTPVGDDTEMV